jgi:hypothetical protein
MWIGVSSGSAYFAARSISINTTPDLELLTPDRCGATTQPVDWRPLHSLSAWARSSAF